jgi:hypothetical protein
VCPHRLLELDDVHSDDGIPGSDVHCDWETSKEFFLHVCLQVLVLQVDQLA